MIILRMMYDVWQGAATSNWGWLITFFFLLLAYYRHDANVTHVSTLLLGTSLFLTHGFNTAVLLLLRHQCFSKIAMGTAWPNRVYNSKFLPNVRINRQADMLSLDGFSLGNIFARQQSIVGPISNGKKACVVVFPSVLLVLVHGPLQHCFSGLRQVGKPHYFCLCRVDHMSVWSRMCLPSHREFILSEPECVEL